MSPGGFDANLFLDAQENTHRQALSEIRAGRKRTHWMWWEFPQVAGITERHGRTPTPTSVRYALRGVDDARAYLDQPVLRARYAENLEAAAAHIAADGAGTYDAVSALFGSPDNRKFVSSLTLFDIAAARLDHAECTRITEIAARVFSGGLTRCPDTPVILGLAGH
ncbi:MAG: DUF1810 family protein [Ilumatobacteraceae bacterium]